MKEYKMLICILIFAIISPILFGLIIGKVMNKPKIGVTIIDGGSDSTDVTYENKTITLIDNDRDEFNKILKKQRDSVEIETGSEIDYDIIIDFKNGHTGKISTKEKVVVYNKHIFGEKLSDKDIEDLLEIINRNINN